MAHLAVYGVVGIPRVYCESCGRHALVIDGEKQCCNTPVYCEPKTIRRMTQAEQKRRQISKSLKMAVLESQNNCCLYCGQEFNTWILRKGKLLKLKPEWDHVEPFSYGQNNGKSNYVAACRMCNAWKSSKMFDSIEEIKSYVKTRWTEEKEKQKVTDL